MKYNLELLCNIKNVLGEGPYYDYRNKNISFIDIVGKKLHIIDSNKNIKSTDFKERIGAAIPMNDCGYMICAENALYIYKNGNINLYKSLDSIMDKGMRCNDAKADSFGRLWFSTMMDDGVSKPQSGLYTIINDEIVLKDSDIKLGNGLAWSADNKKLYYADSIARMVYVYDFDLNLGDISNRRVLFDVDGIPDGMTIDANGNLFVCIWGGSRIEIRSSIDGRLIDTISMPTKLVTSCTFSGTNLDELIITTAKLDETDEYAGCLFKLKLDYKGIKENFIK